MARYPKNATPLLTAALIEKIADAIRRGVYVETAVALCGISKQTLYRWLRQAREGDANSLVTELRDAVEKAAAEAEERDLAVIDNAAQAGVWQAAAWRLERKHPERWGRSDKVRLEHSGPEGGPVQIEARRSTYRKLLEDPGAIAAIELIENKLEGASSETD